MRNTFVQKPHIIPPPTKLGGHITGMKGNQIKDMKRKYPALTVKYNNVKNSGVL